MKGHPYVGIDWTSPSGEQESAAGYFEKVTDDGWIVLDWGFAVHIDSKDFRMYHEDPPVWVEPYGSGHVAVMAD